MAYGFFTIADAPQGFAASRRGRRAALGFGIRSVAGGAAHVLKGAPNFCNILRNGGLRVPVAC
jgi:hypothetical protein